MGRGNQNHTWDALAESYESNRSKDAVYMSCVQLTAKFAHGAGLVLDAGCGTGMVSCAISDNTHCVAAVDYSRESLGLLQSKGKKNIFPICSDIVVFPFADSSFDTVVCSNTLQHFNVEQQACIAKELYRVLKPNGKIVVSVHHFSRVKEKMGWMKEGDSGQKGVGYIYRFDVHEMTALFPGCKVYGAGYYKLWRVPYFGSRAQNIVCLLLGRLLARLRIGHMLIVVGENRV